MPAESCGSPESTGALRKPDASPEATSSRWQRWGPYLLLVALNLLAGSLLGGRSLWRGTLYWDRLWHYSWFRDVHHSLNYFGEMLWWNPASHGGSPDFYPSHVGGGLFAPLSALAMVFSWVLGRAGIIIENYLVFYTMDFTYVVPLLFSVAFYLLASQIFKNWHVRIYILIVAAFSPGVVYGLGEGGLEHTAYGLLWAAAFLWYYRRPGPGRFLWGVLASAVVLVSFCFLGLFWNLAFLPLFAFSVIFWHPPGVRAGLTAAWRGVPWYAWLGAAVLLATFLVPLAISYPQGADILRTKTESRWYAFDDIIPGNPMEFLAASTPGIGFEIAGTESWRLWAYFETPVTHWHLAYNYMGVFCLPLFLLGLCAGRDPWRRRLFFMTAMMILVICLSAWSGLFATVLAWPTPLRAVNHFSDLSFRLGLFFLMILGSALGLETLLEGGRRRTWGFFVAVAFSTAVGIAILVSKYGMKVFVEPLPAFFFAMTVFAVINAIRSCRLPQYDWKRGFGAVLLLLVLVDVSTVSFIHVRTFMWKEGGPFNVPLTDPPPGVIEMPNDSRAFMARTLLMLRPQYEAFKAGITPEQLNKLPYLAVWDSARRMSPQDARGLDFGPVPFLILDPDAPETSPFAPFILAQNVAADRRGTARVTRRTYNRLELEVEVDRPKILFWRDAYFPGWKATVDGQPAEISRAFWMFKAVVIPAGRSEVKFEFSQPWLFGSVLWCYGVLTVLGVAAIVARLRRRAGPS